MSKNSSNPDEESPPSSPTRKRYSTSHGDIDNANSQRTQDTPWMSTGSASMMRDTATHLIARFVHADIQTDAEMAQNLHQDDDALIRHFGSEEELERLTRAETDFAWRYFEAELKPSRSYLFGLAATFGSLLVFRKAPTLIRSIRSSSSDSVLGSDPTRATSSGYQFDRFPSSTTSRASGGGNRIVKSLRFALEFTASSFIGLNVFDHFFDRAIDQYTNHVPDLPLVEGVSVVSRYKCPTYMRIYGSAPSGFWRDYERALGGEEDDDLRTSLKYYEKWAVNCARREAFEQRLRQSRGSIAGGVGNDSKSNMPIPIPSPGVPKDYPVKIEDIGKDLDEGP